MEELNNIINKVLTEHDSMVNEYLEGNKKIFGSLMGKIVKEVVELLQGFRIRYNKRQQYLSKIMGKNGLIV